eukprot:12011421-Alexandrium_andersonii.AAC.1
MAVTAGGVRLIASIAALTRSSSSSVPLRAGLPVAPGDTGCRPDGSCPLGVTGLACEATGSM